jgi:predicted Zn-dependent peptidase
MDAFTAKECICFNIKVLDEHLPVAMDVLSDLVLHPVFDADDIARERGVILEEIKMDQDNPDYLVHEIFTQSFWKDHALGMPILGTRETVKKFERPVVSRFYGHHFAPGNLIVSAAGNLDHEQFVELVTKHFAPVKAAKKRFAFPRTEDFLADQPAQQEVARASSDLYRSAVASHGARAAICFLHLEHAARRRHEFAPVSEYSRTPRAGVFHL